MGPGNTAAPRVSVVIPVLDDEESLQVCLDALRKQTIGLREFEILVVDNGSSRPPQVDLPSNAVLLLEPAPGSYRARNRGVSKAGAPVLAFTDADCIPEPDWLAAALRHLDADPGLEIVGGRVEVFPVDPAGRTPAELYESVFAFPQERYVQERHFSVTANLVLRRRVIDRIGVFQPELRSGGDVEYGNRAAAAGLTLSYRDDVVVKHSARRTLRALRGKLKRQMAGSRDLARMRGDPYPFPPSSIARQVVPPVPTCVRFLRNPQIGSRWDRLKLAYAIVVMHYSRLSYQIRLRYGGVSPR